MFSLILSLMLFVGQESNYVYNSEGVIFKESPAFTLRLEEPSPSPKTSIRVSKVEKKAESKPFRINIPSSIQGDLNLAVGGISSGVPVVKERVTPPVKIEEKKKVTETVYFDFDSYELKPGEKVKLDSLSKDTQYRATGYTCDIGGKSYNDRLALNRARAVQNYLGSIVKEVDGKGKCCYVDLKERWRNRRVEIKPIK
jgi:outer membrane protein OmpA-like peptidoglycan-associated protein